MKPQILTKLGVLCLALVASCANGSAPGEDRTRPRNLTATPSGSEVALSWKGVSEAGSYYVYASDSSDTTTSEENWLGEVSEPSAVVDGLPPGQTYFFAVTAIQGFVESAPSNIASALVGGNPGGPGPGGPGPDPLLSEQWHLENRGQGGGTPGEDARVTNAWSDGTSGSDVVIAVVDDGLEIAHEDLAANVVPGMSFDYVDGDTDPTGGAHGTACAGVAASVRDNGVGGAGAAPEARLAGYNVLANLNSANTVDAMTRNATDVAVSSNSWGAPDGLGVPQPSEASWKQAVESGLQNGRNGRGTVYVWAAGNGALGGPEYGVVTDNSNLDGQANFHGVMAIGAVGDDGVRAEYSEPGANLWVCAPSMGRGDHGITTTDRSGGQGYNPPQQGGGDYGDVNYTAHFNGTSSATPLAAGVVALVLEANPNLSWRDVRQVIARSARQNDAGNADWTTNGAGHAVNHEYGFGVVDAEEAVRLARRWTNLPPLQTVITPARQPSLPIPDANPNGVSDTLTVSGSGIRNLEYVEIVFDAPDHTWSADLQIELVSPTGTVSLLAEPHNVPQQARPPVPYQVFSFGSARHLDEPADGDWTLRVSDRFAQDTGTFDRWQLVFHGH